MTRLIIALLLMITSTALAADKTYYSYPDATTLPDTGRILMYDPGAGSKNVTGAKIRTTPSDTAISAQPINPTNPFQRVFEARDAAGKITTYITASGTLTIGTPMALSVLEVYPANGATGVATSSVPYIGFNKSILATISSMYILGDSTPPVIYDNNGAVWAIPATLAANTTYTIRVVKASILHDAMDLPPSCGTAMADASGFCISTFTTAP